MWEKTKNLANLDVGSYRSVLGYAGESIAIGRALVCGYNLFFKAWRDAKYDAVLDSKKNLFRVEIKQTSGDSSLTLTSGGRGGKQIKDEVKKGDESREKVLSTDDCDFVIGVQSLRGNCWIIPVELLEILGKKSITISQLSIFDEKWKVFDFETKYITVEMIKKGFRDFTFNQLEDLCIKLNISIPSHDSEIKLTNLAKPVKVNKEKRMIYEIWMYILSHC